MHPIVNSFIEYAKIFIQHRVLRHASELVVLPVYCISTAKALQSNRDIVIQYFFVTATPPSWSLNTRPYDQRHYNMALPPTLPRHFTCWHLIDCNEAA